MMAIVMTAILQLNQQGQFVGQMRWWIPPSRNDFPLEDNAQLVGRSLMTTYTLAFWVASAILTIAMIGALILARSERDMPGEGHLSIQPTEPEEETGKEEGK